MLRKCALAAMIAVSCSTLGANVAHAMDCAPVKSTRVYQRGEVAVYREGDEYFACSRSSGKSVDLGNYFGSAENSTFEFRHPVADGRYLAFESLTQDSMGGDQYYVQLYDARVGKKLRSLATGKYDARRVATGADSILNRGIGPTTVVRVNASGDVAWIAYHFYDDAPRVYEVHAARFGGTSHRLDYGRTVAKAQLAFRRRVVCWRKGSEVRRKALAG